MEPPPPGAEPEPEAFDPNNPYAAYDAYAAQLYQEQHQAYAAAAAAAAEAPASAQGGQTTLDPRWRSRCRPG